MNAAALFSSILNEQYATAGASVQLFPVSLNDERAAFQVNLPNSERWIVHAQRQDCSIPAWLDGCGAPDPLAFLRLRAQTLVYLQQHRYPAPRVVRTRDGALVGEAHGWATLVTTYIPGDVTEPTVDQLRLMGAALGKLHNVPLTHNAQIGTSWWYPEKIIGSALAQLALVDGQVPPQWVPLHQAMRTTLETAQGWTHLPRTIIHADAWAGNGVQTKPDEVVLIDWDPSGIGWPILDLARLLIQSPVNSASPMDRSLQPDLRRINAIIDGYCTERMPTSAELNVLAHAICFTVAAGGAWWFTNGSRNGWDQVAPTLARRQQLYNVSDEYARIARARLDQFI